MPARENDAVRARAAMLYAEGVLDLAQIGEELGCCASSVLNWAREAGVPPRGRARSLARAQAAAAAARAMNGPADAHVRAAVLARYAAGEKTQAVAAAFGLSVSTVERRVREAGLPRRLPDRTFRAPVPAEDILRLYRDGVPVLQITARTGVGLVRLYALVHGAGLSRHARPRRSAAGGVAPATSIRPPAGQPQRCGVAA